MIFSHNNQHQPQSTITATSEKNSTRAILARDVLPEAAFDSCNPGKSLHKLMASYCSVRSTCTTPYSSSSRYFPSSEGLLSIWQASRTPATICLLSAIRFCTRRPYATSNSTTLPSTWRYGKYYCEYKLWILYIIMYTGCHRIPN